MLVTELVNITNNSNLDTVDNNRNYLFRALGHSSFIDQCQ